MVSGEEQNLPLSVVNRGETGVYVAQLKESGRIIAEKRMLIPQGEQCNDSLVFTLYAEGKHELTFEGQSFTLDVTDNQAKQPMVCLQLDAPSLSRQSDTLRISLQLQNRSGKRRTSILPIQVNQEEVAQLEASLNPGECQTYLVELPHLSEGMKKVEVLGMHHLVKIYSQPQDACLVDLHCGNIPTGNATDHSGFGNDATAHGAIVWGKDYLETNHQAYLSLPLSKSLMTPNQQVTLLTWIAPQERPNGNADFFTQGDYCCFKMDDPHTLVFFTGGWGRGECKVTVPDDWYTDWHLIAGICTGPTLQIYIDGELKKEITVSGQLAANKAPWNIGRNAEIPYSRFWRARFNRMRIYGTALTATDVREIYEKERATINKGN